MDKPIELVALVCYKCNNPIPAEAEEVAWVCAQCGQGLCLDEEAGLAPLEVYYSDKILPNKLGKPYWVVEGKVSVNRETYGSFGKQNSEAEIFWSQGRLFFVPAFTCTLEDLLSKATTLLLQPPNLQAGPGALFDPVTLSTDAIFPAVEFIVMAIEAGRKDKLKKAFFDLKLNSPVLWVLP